MKKLLQFKDPNNPDLVIDYFLEKKAIKNIYMRTNSKNQITISAPTFLPKIIIDQFIEKNIVSFYESITLVQKVRSSIDLDQQSFYLFGKKLKFEIDQINHNVIVYDLYLIKLSIKVKSVREAIEEFCKKQLKVHLIQRQLQWEKTMAIDHHHLYVRHKSRAWATNYVSSKKIYYSTHLSSFPKSIIDYVIVHELAHHLEANHSKNFWKIVAKYEPDYKIKKKKLNFYQYQAN